VLKRRCCAAVGTGAGAQFDTRRPASCGHPRCRESTTYVRDPGHCEPPDDRRDNSSVPGCGEKSHAGCDSPADRIKEQKKRFCRVTTRRRNFWFWNGLGRGLGLLAARSFCLGMLGFDLVGLATFGLPTRLQPAVDLPLAFRILAVTLVPTPRLVLATAPLAQAFPLARVASSGVSAVLSRTLTGAHGRFDLPRESPGRMCQHSPRALSKREQNDCLQVYGVLREQDREQDGFKSAPGNKTTGSRATIVALSKRSRTAPNS
jgi:hypothetical protein